MDTNIAKEVLNNNISDIYKNKELFDILKENNFFANKDETINSLPNECKKNFCVTIRGFMLILFVISLIVIVKNINKTFIWNSLMVFKLNVDIFDILFFGIVFSIITTILHEFMHVVFSNSLKNIKDIFNISLKKSVVHISITHVWTWSLLSRLMAVSAGVILDIFILACIMVLKTILNVEVLSLMAVIMFLRIIWQFRFHKQSDGKYFLMMLIDNPMIDIDFRCNISLLNRKEIFFWRLCIVFGKLVDLYLLIFWLIPLICKVCILIY